jgi:hypothetical protein
MAVAKRALAVVLAVICLVATAGTAVAQAYTVRGIEVDVEAENAVMAREMAIESAQREGLRRVLERLTLPQYVDRLPAADQQALSTLVTAFEVEEESTSATRYVGRLSVSYDEAAVQALLQGTAVPIVLETPPSLLVVPALQEADGLAVFTGPEGWRDAWSTEATRNTLLDIRLPVGDLVDLRTLGPQALEDEPENALALAAERYGAEAAILLVARADDPSSPTRVAVTERGNHGWRTGFAGDSLTMDADPTTVWQAAVRRTKTALENEWKAGNLVAMDQIARLPVSVALGSLEEWADLRRRLDQVGAIRDIDVETFSQQRADLVFNHIGNVDQLQRALEARGLQLSEGAGTWQLQRTAGQPAG